MSNTSSRKLGALGEWGLIERLQKFCRSNDLRNPPRYQTFTPWGDDAFVAQLKTQRPLALTTDTLVEGTHFRLDWGGRYFSAVERWKMLGQKAMAVNLSDLAAMGAVEPLWALVTLGVNGDISVDIVDKIFVGMRHCGQNCGQVICGGDIIRSEKLMISVALVGAALSPKQVVNRSGAQPGEWLLTSGFLGDSAAGLWLLQREKSRVVKKRKEEQRLVRRHLAPTPRLELGRILSLPATRASALIDTSDDLQTSLARLGQAGRVGFELSLERLSASPALQWLCAAEKLRPADFAVLGGEDYELLFTMPPERAQRLLKVWPSARVIGRVEKMPGARFSAEGKIYSPRKQAFEHLR